MWVRPADFRQAGQGSSLRRERPLQVVPGERDSHTHEGSFTRTSPRTEVPSEQTRNLNRSGTYKLLGPNLPDLSFDEGVLRTGRQQPRRRKEKLNKSALVRAKPFSAASQGSSTRE